MEDEAIGGQRLLETTDGVPLVYGGRSRAAAFVALIAVKLRPGVFRKVN